MANQEQTQDPTKLIYTLYGLIKSGKEPQGSTQEDLSQFLNDNEDEALQYASEYDDKSQEDLEGDEEFMKFYSQFQGNPEEDAQQQAQYAAKGAKLAKLRKGKTAKCSCGCDLITKKEAGGKMITKCACGCKGISKKESGGILKGSAGFSTPITTATRGQNQRFANTANAAYTATPYSFANMPSFVTEGAKFVQSMNDKFNPPKTTTPVNRTPNTNVSIVDYLNSTKQSGGSGYTNRKALAAQYGISNYTGQGYQNAALLNAMKSFKNRPADGTQATSGTVQGMDMGQLATPTIGIGTPTAALAQTQARTQSSPVISNRPIGTAAVNTKLQMPGAPSLFTTKPISFGQTIDRGSNYMFKKGGVIKGGKGEKINGLNSPNNGDENAIAEDMNPKFFKKSKEELEFIKNAKNEAANAKLARPVKKKINTDIVPLKRK